MHEWLYLLPSFICPSMSLGRIRPMGTKLG